MTHMNTCGTYAGYSRHRRAGEPVCQPCKDAQAAYQRNRYRQGPTRPHAKGAKYVIVDVLSTYVEWMELETLIGRVQLHRPDLSDGNIQRALARLKDEGRVQVRERRLVRERGEAFEYYCDEWSAYAS